MEPIKWTLIKKSLHCRFFFCTIDYRGESMSKKLFSNKEIEILKNNKYVLNVTDKGITYTNEFKIQFIADSNNGMSSREIFEKADFDINIVGLRRIESAGSRWRADYRKNGISGLDDTRRNNSGRPRVRKLTQEEVLKRKDAEIAYLKAEIDLLKKLELSEREVKNRLSSSAVYKLIEDMNKTFKRSIKYLCEIANITRSAYYAYLSNKEEHDTREKHDIQAKDIILKAFNYKGFKKGSRSIKMVLQNKFNIVFSRKKIQRIMRKFDIICPFRKPNPYKRMAKATKEHSVVKNKLNRNFKQEIPAKVLLTDITYLPYSNSHMAYLSTIKDASTNEILAYNISGSLEISLVLDTVNKLVTNKNIKLHKDAFIHSDQGSHYTSPKFQKLLKKCNIGQSMSRRGNCWDNAPQESFFGHMKDEVDYKSCTTLEEVKSVIRKYMTYYNNYRYQWNLKKLTPVQYRNQLLVA